MDPSLWLLIRLRAGGWARRFGRSLRSPKGVLLAVVGGLIFLPMIIGTFFSGRMMASPSHLDAVRRYAPLGLLAYCVLSVLTSNGERALYYSPAEVNFLFTGPFRPRQLVLYKLATGLGASLLSAPFMAMAFRGHAAGLLQALFGIIVTLQLIYLVSVAISLSMNIAGAMAVGRARRVVAVALAVVAAGAVLPRWLTWREAPPLEQFNRLLESTPVRVLLAPFRPFADTLTAEHVWPDLLVNGAAAAAIDLSLAVLVVALNAQFLEASAASSARVYERIKRARRGAGWSTAPVRVRFTLPMPPDWGGFGPNVWRQLVSLSRSPAPFIGLTLMFLFPVGMILFVTGNDPARRGDPVYPALAVFGSMALFAPTLASFDFRLDLDRMEFLKTLPVRATTLAAAQLVAPLVVVCTAEWLVLGLLAAWSRSHLGVLFAAAALLPPVNLLMVAIENLYFLWYPFRTAPAQPFDVQFIGRQMLLFMAKFVTLAGCTAVAAGAGAILYFVTGGWWPAAVAASWVTALGSGVALVPIVGEAFRRFDVAATPPE